MPLLRLTEVMAELAVGRSKLYALVRSGELPTIRVGHDIRVRPADLDAFLEAHRTQPREPWR